MKTFEFNLGKSVLVVDVGFENPNVSTFENLEEHFSKLCAQLSESLEIKKELAKQRQALQEQLGQAHADAAVMRQIFESHLETMTAINRHVGFQFTQTLMNARNALSSTTAGQELLDAARDAIFFLSSIDYFHDMYNCGTYSSAPCTCKFKHRKEALAKLQKAVVE